MTSAISLVKKPEKKNMEKAKAFQFLLDQTSF